MPQPLRDDKEIDATFDPETGLKRVFDALLKQDLLSDAGSVDSAKARLRVAHGCGCFGEPGGRCGICGTVDCKACFGRCCRCQRPLCQRHSRFLPEPDGTRGRYCPSCHEVARLQRQVAKGLSLLTAPFRRGRKGP
jgi:hypothetical protein